MTLIADTGALYALFDRRDRHHRAVRDVVDTLHDGIVLPATVLLELDYLLRVKLGVKAELDALDNVLSGAFTYEPVSIEDIARSREIIEQYLDLDLGLADASVVAVAERLGVHRILTVDLRDFRAIRTNLGHPLMLLPADA